MIIRTALAADVPQLLSIYNYEVVSGTATFDINEKSLEEWTRWFDAHNVGNHPLIVAVVDDAVAGYASLSPYREKEAYASTVELSVYVHKDYRCRGVATALLQEILRLASEDERTHMVISVITSDNEVSIKLHERFGFAFCGTMHDVGIKFGRYLSISNFELKV